MARQTRHCEDCGTEVFGKCHFCDRCATARNTARQRVRREQERVKRLAEGWQDGRTKRFAGDVTDDDVARWDAIAPVVPRTVEYEPEPVAPSLAAFRVECAVSQAVRITGRLDLTASSPADNRVKTALADARAAGCSDNAIDASIQRGVRAGSGVRRLPDAEEQRPEEISLEELMRDDHGLLRGRFARQVS